MIKNVLVGLLTFCCTLASWANTQASFQPSNQTQSQGLWFSLDELDNQITYEDTEQRHSLLALGNSTLIPGKHCSAINIASGSSSRIGGLKSSIQINGFLDQAASISFWFRTTNDLSQGNQPRILFDASTTNAAFGLRLNQRGQLEFFFTDAAGNPFLFTTLNHTFLAEQWQHLSVSWDFTAQKVAFFVDGQVLEVNQSQSDWSVFSSLPVLNLLMFGDAQVKNSFNGNVQSVAGSFDDIHIQPSFITPAELQRLNNAKPSCPVFADAFFSFDGLLKRAQHPDAQQSMLGSQQKLNFAAGRICQSAYFDETSTALLLPGDEFSFSNSQNFSASFWFNPLAISSQAAPVLISQAQRFQVSLTRDGEIQLGFFDAQQQWQQLTSKGANVTEHNWQHLAFTLSETYQRIWLDGQLVLNNLVSFGLTDRASGDLHIAGHTTASVSSKFQGRIDELRFYSQALTLRDVNRDRLRARTCQTDLTTWLPLNDPFYSNIKGALIDHSGKRQDATGHEKISASQGYQCLGAGIGSNVSVFEQQGIVTDAQVSQQGTILFWFNSQQDWAGGQKRILIDASTDSANAELSANKYFYLAIDTNGALYFDFEDALDDDDFFLQEPVGSNRQAGHWYHIALVWDFSEAIVAPSLSSPVKLFVDGELKTQSLQIYEDRALVNSRVDGIPLLNAITVGDNASSYNYVPGASADGIFDEVRVYQRALTQAEIVDASVQQHPCPQQAIADYRFEQALWEGEFDEIIDDSGANFHATRLGSVTPKHYTAQCQAAYFSNLEAEPNNRQAIVTPLRVNRDIGDNGSLNFWLKKNPSSMETKVEQVLFDASRGEHSFYASLLADGRLNFMLSDAAGKVHQLSSETKLVSKQQWQLISFIWSQQQRRMLIAINGEINNAQPLPADFSLAPLSTLYLGAPRNSNTNKIGWSGWLENFTAFDRAIDATELNGLAQDSRPCMVALDHFELVDAAPVKQALTCQADPINLSAKLANGSNAQDFIGTVELQTLSGKGDWLFTGDAAHNFRPGPKNSGKATIDFTIADQGYLTGLALAHDEPGQVEIALSVAGQRLNSTSSGNAKIDFSRSGLQVSLASQPNAPINLLNLVAAMPSPELQLAAVTQNTQTGRCQALFDQAQRVALTVDSRCEQPNSCVPGRKIRFSHLNESNDLANPQNRENGGSSEAINLQFDEHGKANFQLTTTDIGSYKLEFTYPSPNEQIGTLLTLQSRPAELAIVSIDGNKVGSLNTEAAFKKAGERFSLAIEALDANGASLPSFARFSRSHDVSFSQSNLASPTAGRFIELSGNTSAGQWRAVDIDADFYPERLQLDTNASGYTGLRFSEVGSINLVASIEDFQGYGQSVTSKAVKLGRFIPAYLQVTEANTEPAQWGTQGYLYQGQAEPLTKIAFHVEAFDINNQRLHNYHSAAVRFDPVMEKVKKPKGVNRNGESFNNTGAELVNAPFEWQVVTGPANSKTLKSVRLTSQINDLNWQRKRGWPDANDAVQTIQSFELPALAFTDADGVCVQSENSSIRCLDVRLNIAPRKLYYGRLALEDEVNGTQSSAKIAAQIEFLAGFQDERPVFTLQTNENGQLVRGLKLQSASNCGLQHCPEPGAIDGVTLIASNGLAANFERGKAYLDYSLPQQDYGLMTVQADSPEWLNWDWRNNGQFIPPSSTILFGEYLGRTPILFLHPSYR